MTGQQQAKKLWEIGFDKTVHNAMGGWISDLRNAPKEAMEEALRAAGHSETDIAEKLGEAFPGFWKRAGRKIAAGASGGGRMGGGLLGGIGSVGGRALNSFLIKAPGRMGRGIAMGAGLVDEARKTAVGFGKIGQVLLTGKGPRTSFGDAFFPFFKTHAATDPAKYALNPAIARRLVYAAAPIAVLSGLKEALRPAAPPPSVYFDGRYMRHINDMGASADYGQKMMGPNSILNEGTRGQLLSQIGHLL